MDEIARVLFLASQREKNNVYTYCDAKAFISAFFFFLVLWHKHTHTQSICTGKSEKENVRLTWIFLLDCWSGVRSPPRWESLAFKFTLSLWTSVLCIEKYHFLWNVLFWMLREKEKWEFIRWRLWHKMTLESIILRSLKIPLIMTVQNLVVFFWNKKSFLKYRKFSRHHHKSFIEALSLA